MASVTVTHSTPADGTFSGAGSAAYTPLVTPISLMQTEQIVDEIRYLMRQKMQRDEAIALILIAANL